MRDPRGVALIEDRRRQLAFIGTMSFGNVIYAYQQTMVVPALSRIQEELHTSTAWVTWVLTASLLVTTVATPLLGKLGDQFGKRRLLLVALSCFLVGSVVSAAAPNLPTLIAGRAVQGLGGGLIPLGYALLNDHLPPARRGQAIGFSAGMNAFGAAIGFFVSGAILDHASWRLLFATGPVLVAIVLVLILLIVPESPIKTPARLDAVGAVLLSLALLCFLFAVTEGSHWGWTSPRVLALFAAFPIVLAVWVGVELRMPEPMVDVRMLAKRAVALTNVVTFIIGSASYGTFVLATRFVVTPHGLASGIASRVHYGLGSSATMLAVYVAPGSLFAFLLSARSGAWAQRHSPKPIVLVSLGSFVVGTTCFVLWHHTWLHAVIALTLFGVGPPIATGALVMLILGTVRPTETGVAAGINFVIRMAGAAVGSQVAAAILSSDTIAGTSVPTEHAYVVAFMLFAASCTAGAAVAWLITPRRRREALVVAEAAD